MRRMNRRFNRTTICLLIVILLALLAAPQAMAKTFNWRLQSVWTTKTTTKYLNEFAENVKKATDGQVLIKVYTANQLVKVKSTLGAVQSGAIEMACGSGLYNASIIPEGNIEAGLPFSWRNWSELSELWSKYGLREKVREAYAEKGLFFLALQSAGDYTIMTTKPVRKVKDFDGLKIRTYGLVANILKRYGVAPVAIPGAEQYIALQRGTADGTVFPAFVLDAYKLREVIKYVILPSVIDPPTTNIYVNMKAWQSLGPDLQEKIESVAQLHTVAYDRELKQAMRDPAIENFKKQGGEVITLPESEIAKLRQAAYEEWEILGQTNPRMKEMIQIVYQYMEDKGLR